MADARIEVIYCDDIRAEMYGKASLIGVYHGDLLVEQLPVVLPKLCAWVTIVCPVEQNFQRISSIRMVQGEGEEAQTIYAFEEEINLQDISLLQDSGKPSAKFLAVNVSIIISPLWIEKETLLRVIVEIDSEKVLSRALVLRKLRSGTADSR